MDPSSPYYSLWIILALLAFPLLFVGLVGMILAILSVASGWRTLAKRYRAEGKPQGRRVSGSVIMNLVSYQNFVALRIGHEGLSLALTLPFKGLHPPLFIPWSEVAGCEISRVLFIEVTTVSVGPRRNPITVSGGAGVAIRKEWEAWRARQAGGAAGGATAEARALHQGSRPSLPGSSLPGPEWLRAQQAMPISVPHQDDEPVTERNRIPVQSEPERRRPEGE